MTTFRSATRILEPRPHRRAEAATEAQVHLWSIRTRLPARAAPLGVGQLGRSARARPVQGWLGSPRPPGRGGRMPPPRSPAPRSCPRLPRRRVRPFCRSPQRRPGRRHPPSTAARYPDAPDGSRRGVEAARNRRCFGLHKRTGFREAARQIPSTSAPQPRRGPPRRSPRPERPVRPRSVRCGARPGGTALCRAGLPTSRRRCWRGPRQGQSLGRAGDVPPLRHGDGNPEPFQGHPARLPISIVLPSRSFRSTDADGLISRMRSPCRSNAKGKQRCRFCSRPFLPDRVTP